MYYKTDVDLISRTEPYSYIESKAIPIDASLRVLAQRGWVTRSWPTFDYIPPPQKKKQRKTRKRSVYISGLFTT